MLKQPIVYIITSLSVGGAQKALLNLLKSELSLDYPPLVISLVDVPGIQEQFIQTGIPLYILDLNCLKTLPNKLMGFWHVMQKHRPAIIHGWMHHGNIIATLIWGLTGCRARLLWSMHHTPEAETLKRWQHALVIYLGQWLSRFPARIIYVSQRSLQRHQQLGYSSAKAQVVANGISEIDNVSQNSDGVRQELDIDLNTPIIGSLTRYVPEKDIPNLFEAIRLSQKQNLQAAFILAGEGMVATNPHLQVLLQALPEPQHVYLLGVRTDAQQLIASFTLATLSSKREALPLFLLEAMAQGIPCVATDVGDVAELIRAAGIVVPVADPQALAQAWRQILQQSSAEKTYLSQQAKQQIKLHYSLEAVVNNYRQLLRSILST